MLPFRRFLLGVGLLILSCVKDLNDQGLSVQVVDEGTFLAFPKGGEHRTVRIGVPDDTGFGSELTVTTSLGLLNRAASGAEARTAKLTTQGEESLELTLYSDAISALDSETGEIIVTGARGIRGSTKFTLHAVTSQVAIEAPTEVQADGKPHELQIAVDSSTATTHSVLVTTDSGTLSPGTGADQRTATVQVRGGSTKKLNWFPGTTADTTARLNATLEVNDASDEVTVSIKPVPLSDATVALTTPDSVLADGSSHPLTLNVTSSTDKAREVVVTTTLGSLSPRKAGEAADQATLQVRGEATLVWTPGSTPGQARITARLAENGFARENVVPVEPLIRLVTLDVPSSQPLADNVTQLPVAVHLNGPTTLAETVVLTTNLGVLDPSTSAKQTSVTLFGDQTTEVHLFVGRTPGPVVLSAKIEDTNVGSASLTLNPALPSSVVLSLENGSSVFKQGATSATVKVRLARGSGQGQVSFDTQVFFQSCCDMGSGVENCDQLISAEALTVVHDGESETQNVVLSPAGLAYVQNAGDPTRLDLALYAWVSETADGSGLSCEELSAAADADEPPDGIAALTFLPLALERPSP